MKITLFTAFLGVGGANKMLSELVNYWDVRGHKVYVVHIQSPDHQSFYKLNPRVTVIPMQRYHARPIKKWDRLCLSIKGLFFIRRTVIDLKPDIIVSFIDKINISVLLATLGLKIPKIVSERVDPTFHPVPWIYSFLRSHVYKWADRIHIQTESGSNYFRPKLSNILSVIPNWIKNPIKTKTIQDIQNPVKKLIVFARLTYQKSLETLIQAFALIAPEFPDIILTIYGEGDERTKLEYLVQSLSLQDRIFLPGVITNVEDVLVQADLFVFPSRYEGMPNALCEAMNVGLPVIASNCSGNIDVVVDNSNGRLFPVGDIKRCAELMRELILDPDQRVKLSRQAIKITDTLSPETILPQWDKMIQEVMEQKKK